MSIARRPRMPNSGDGAEPSVTEPSVAGTSSPRDSPVVSEVFSMFKSYLEVKLDVKSKQLYI